MSPLFCLFLILIIGVSHGSLDHVKGGKLLKIFKIENISLFYISYILLAAMVVTLWIFIPSILLIIFLLVASYHFGKEDTQFLHDYNSHFIGILYFLKGSLVILAPLYFHFDETIAIFKLLLIDNENFYSSLSFIENNRLIDLGIILSSLSSIILFIKKFTLKNFSIFFDYFSILILNYYLSPLIAFTAYFCFLHSVRHSITLIYELDNTNIKKGLLIFIKKAMPLTILTAIICLVGIYLLNFKYDFDNSIIKVIFIGLASLTFPHILLEYLLDKNEKQRT
ncbi:Brp/Blh family beta-carotene 15,15'-dioxygenase [Candidatus Pelagibacter sp.]|uniref:Brp/Blh family beta-carotene 15,15'-dioxygenase n=1 Tax=Candidatus Pelagibacter sp. TaxID=2024849 RepID=UPI003F8409F8